MKKQNITGLLVGLCVCALPLAGQAQANHVNIMPFGDSVTSRGTTPESSYRYWLWQDLQNAGFSNIDFIGSQNGVTGGGPPANSWPDEEYEGGEGWTSADALNRAPGAATFDGGPQIVLLDFGSNDISPAGIPLDETISNLDQVIQDFAAQNPSVIILIARPTPFAPDPSSSPQDQQLQRREQAQLAGRIGRLASTERRAGINVIAVNLFGGFSIRNDTTDGAHPNVIGEQKIAARYFQVLRRLLRKM